MQPLSFPSVLLIALLILAHTRAFPLTESLSLEITKEHLQTLPPLNPKYTISKRNLITSSTPTHALTLQTYASFLPLSLASSALQDFYTTLFSQATGPWQSLPNLPHFTAEYGNIFLNFQASPPYLIPWSFIAEFAEKMIRATELGFTGQFEGEYRHLATGAVIEVGLRVVLVAAAA